MRSHAIASDRMRSRKKTFLSRLSKFLKMHREQEAGQKVCLKCFFTTTVNRFHLLFFSPFSKRKKWEAGLILHSKTCFFCSQLSWRNTSGRIFSPVSPKQVPNVFLPAIEENIKDRQKATLQAMHVIHACRKESLFFLQTNWTMS